MGGGVCWWGTWILTDAASPGDFLSLEFSQEHKAGKDPDFPTCMNFFLSGKVPGTSKLLFSPGPFPAFSRVSFVVLSTQRDLVALRGSDSEV